VRPGPAQAMDVTAVIIGAGHAGLAASHHLTERSIDHVVLERGEVANSWRTERWDSLRLLTPNWMNRLPGPSPAVTGPDDDPDGFMDAAGVATMIGRYARDVAAPVHTGTTVRRVGRAEGGYVVETDRGTWRCTAIVLASGAANLANVPELAAGVPPDVLQLTPHRYRTADALPDGGVLVVGASATGVQLADEIHRSGRPVTLAVGEHVRLPRRYGGRDVMWWLDASGVLDERWDEVDDLARARRLPSPQLIGSPDGRSIDLNALGRTGVRLAGRVGGVRDGVVQCSGSLANTVALADLKLGRLLRRFDEWARIAGLPIDAAGASDVDPLAPTRVPPDPILEVDLRRGAISTIVWATGFRPDYRWLDLPVLDRRGRIIHEAGVVTGHPGLYVLGTSLLRTRRSNYIDGAAADAASVAEALARHLAGRAGRPAAGWPPGPAEVGSGAGFRHAG
jgi:putative flavoprotein involved in K+ transport